MSNGAGLEVESQQPMPPGTLPESKQQTNRLWVPTTLELSAVGGNGGGGEIAPAVEAAPGAAPQPVAESLTSATTTATHEAATDMATTNKLDIKTKWHTDLAGAVESLPRAGMILTSQLQIAREFIDAVLTTPDRAKAKRALELLSGIQAAATNMLDEVNWAAKKAEEVVAMFPPDPADPAQSGSAVDNATHPPAVNPHPTVEIPASPVVASPRNEGRKRTQTILAVENARQRLFTVLVDAVGGNKPNHMDVCQMGQEKGKRWMLIIPKQIVVNTPTFFALVSPLEGVVEVTITDQATKEKIRGDHVYVERDNFEGFDINGASYPMRVIAMKIENPGNYNLEIHPEDPNLQDRGHMEYPLTVLPLTPRATSVSNSGK